MIEVECYKTFTGTMKISPVNGRPPFYITAQWLYKPEYDCWYGAGRSFSADVCSVEFDPDGMTAEDLFKLLGYSMKSVKGLGWVEFQKDLDAAGEKRCTIRIKKDGASWKNNQSGKLAMFTAEEVLAVAEYIKEQNLVSYKALSEV